MRARQRTRPIRVGVAGRNRPAVEGGGRREAAEAKGGDFLHPNAAKPYPTFIGVLTDFCFSVYQFL
jgi:hypothetical protein